MREPGVHLPWRLPALVASLILVVAACGSSTSSASPGASAGGAGATDGQFCKGMKIVFFPGGTPGGGFETVVYNGAKAAQAAFGPDVTYQWSDWDPNKMITQFQQAVATKPDGIAIMGHPGDDAFDPLIKDAENQGILVTAMNTELPKAEAAVRHERVRLRRRRPPRRRRSPRQRGDRPRRPEVRRSRDRLGPQGPAGSRRADAGHPRRAPEGRPDRRLPRDRRRDEQGSGQRACRSSPATSRRIPTSRRCSSTTAT